MIDIELRPGVSNLAIEVGPKMLSEFDKNTAYFYEILLFSYKDLNRDYFIAKFKLTVEKFNLLSQVAFIAFPEGEKRCLKLNCNYFYNEDDAVTAKDLEAKVSEFIRNKFSSLLANCSMRIGHKFSNIDKFYKNFGYSSEDEKVAQFFMDFLEIDINAKPQLTDHPRPDVEEPPLKKACLSVSTIESGELNENIPVAGRACYLNEQLFYIKNRDICSTGLKKGDKSTVRLKFDGKIQKFLNLFSCPKANAIIYVCERDIGFISSNETLAKQTINNFNRIEAVHVTSAGEIIFFAGSQLFTYRYDETSGQFTNESTIKVKNIKVTSIFNIYDSIYFLINNRALWSVKNGQPQQICQQLKCFGNEGSIKSIVAGKNIAYLLGYSNKYHLCLKKLNEEEQKSITLSGESSNLILVDKDRIALVDGSKVLIYDIDNLQILYESREYEKPPIKLILTDDDNLMVLFAKSFDIISLGSSAPRQISVIDLLN